MTDTTACVCNVPSKANYYVSVIWGADVTADGVKIGTETAEWDMYYCAEHLREYPVGKLELMSDTGQAHNAKYWTVLESTTTHLRGAE